MIRQNESAIDYCRRHDRFAAANGIELIEMWRGCAKARMSVTEDRLNSLGTAHGGGALTLAATTFFAACNAAGETAVGTNMSITCLKPAQRGRSHGRGRGNRPQPQTCPRLGANHRPERRVNRGFSGHGLHQRPAVSAAIG